LSDKRLLFVNHISAKAKFVTNDREILEKMFRVTHFESRLSNNLSFILTFISQFFRLLFSIHKFEVIYIWFADYHSFLPVFFSKLSGKKSYIAVGGYDATYIPEINMGLFTKSGLKKRFRCFCATYSLRHCSMILPVDESLIENENRYIYSDLPGRPVLKDGIKNFIKDIKTPFHTVRLGYDPEIFKFVNSGKERAVVSAGLIVNENEFRRKGFDLLTEVAGKMPDVKFILIGLNDHYMNYIKQLDLKNTELYGKVSYDELIKLYSRAKVYSQLSMFEGMPSAVCEAMLCGCIPVGSDVNGIPGIIGDTGIIVKEKNIDRITEALHKTLEYDEKVSEICRNRITEMFPIDKREKELLKIIK